MKRWTDEEGLAAKSGEIQETARRTVHVTAVCVRISRSGESVDGLPLWSGYPISYKNERY